MLEFPGFFVFWALRDVCAWAPKDGISRIFVLQAAMRPQTLEFPKYLCFGHLKMLEFPGYLVSGAPNWIFQNVWVFELEALDLPRVCSAAPTMAQTRADKNASRKLHLCGK